jgi:pimeloyl-ACP methyl ester carboxylesterase
MNSIWRLQRDDAQLAVHDSGAGEPVLFQHGLGGSDAQVAQVFPDSPDWRRITVECRGHGASTLGQRRPFSIAMFAADVIAAADERGIDRFVAGGISMGAAIALHLAKAYPARITGLILVRPAWTFAAAPENLAPVREVAALLRSHLPGEARSLFAISATAERLRHEAPDNLASLLGYFDRPDAPAFAEVLADIAADGTGVTSADAAGLALPALVIGNRHDALHPIAVAEVTAEALADAAFLEAPAKATDAEKHFSAVRTAIAEFLATNSNDRSPAQS